jgi:BirA family biotin operon repressor/biotin-[acetyl-CoA-carboxylase] ligase
MASSPGRKTVATGKAQNRGEHYEILTNLLCILTYLELGYNNYGMDGQSLRISLSGLPVPDIRYFDSAGSTNDEALAWVAEGADDGCLVVADQQTRGRGRFRRQWITRAGAALAFSLILRPTSAELHRAGFFSPLGAIAICQALEVDPALMPSIKWPNDVLLLRKKVAGILVEASWVGDRPQAVVIGIGINIAAEAVPPASELLFPATSVEEAAGKPVDREALLRAILQALFTWRKQMRSEAFLQAWEARLAFRGEWVQIENSGQAPMTGQVMGIDPGGNLLLRNQAGETTTIAVGDLHLRPME